MSILNVNQIQPVGGGNTIAVSASDVNFSGNISVGSNFIGIVTAANTATVATNAQGLTGTPDIIVNNIQSGVVTATTFIGDGSGITGVTASGSGINIKDGGSTVGVAATVDFGTNLNVSPASAGIVTVTVGDTDFAIVDKIVHTGDTDTAIRFPVADTVTVETAGTERLRITSDGKVGIGETDPSSYSINADNLVITGASHEGITIKSGNSNRGSIYFSDVDAEGRGQIIYQHLIDALDFSTNATQRLRITSDGSVGIGTDNPLNGLDVNQSEGRLRVNRFSHLLMQNKNDSTTDYWGISVRNGGELDIGYGTPDGNSLVGGDKLTITSGGNLSITDGDLVIGTSGHGIDFSATSGTGTSEVLDDYEEGNITTWRLRKDGASTAGSNTGDTYVRYTKIGRCVYISGHIRTDGTQSSQSGNVLLVTVADPDLAATLPFTPNHTGGIPITHTRTINELTSMISLSFVKDSATLYVYANDTTGDYIANTNTLDTNTQTNLVITFSGHFFTDS